MGRGVPVQSLQLFGDFDQSRDRLVFLDCLLELRLAIDGFLQCHGRGRVVGHQLANPVDLRIRHLQYPAHVPERRAGLQGSERNDLGHPVSAVFFLYICDDFVPAVLAKIDIEVGHGHPFRVQEAFEQQPELQRIEIGDGQRPGNHRARARAATRADRDALPLRPANKVGDDDEIARKAHFRDHRELIFQTLPVRTRIALFPLYALCSQPLDQAVGGKIGQDVRVGPFIAVVGRGRQERIAGFGHEGAAPGDDQGVVDGLRQIGE